MNTIPVYNFECLDCEKDYEEYVIAFDKTGLYNNINCPDCGSANKKKVPSLMGRAIFKEKLGTSKMENFGYRAGYNMEKAKGERAAAEAVSIVGKNPYNNIDDIECGKYFGEVQ